MTACRLSSLGLQHKVWPCYNCRCKPFHTHGAGTHPAVLNSPAATLNLAEHFHCVEWRLVTYGALLTGSCDTHGDETTPANSCVANIPCCFAGTSTLPLLFACSLVVTLIVAPAATAYINSRSPAHGRLVLLRPGGRAVEGERAGTGLDTSRHACMHATHQCSWLLQKRVAPFA